MAYCTYLEVQLEVGIALGTITTTDITDMIGVSDREIGTHLRERGITTLPTSDDDLKTASIQFTIAKIKRRQAHELSRPNSLSLGGDISFSVNGETEAAAAEAKGYTAIARYVKFAGGSGVAIVRNHHMFRGY